ncbi:SdpI family protein [Marinicella litoralis]|uniref:Putative membrane protein n=1 Tax=Marinicella litoralis TaxID=644220 RepID=A0A4R6XN15_9GAMM|nr:SdpI family protein [Marinicella litoralis]TDR17508.1 putative membrane protein [Marinicella litoralis]
MKNNTNKKFLIALGLLLIVTWIVAFWYEAKLPEKIPSHWNIEGEVDGYMNKPWGVYMLPIISTITSVVLMLLPKIAPKGFKLESAKSVYETIVLIMAVFMLGVMILIFEAGMNKNIDMNQWMMVGIGSLFIIVGNYLSKVPKNFFLGIRTPWTLASDVVWYKTHRLGSWTFVLAGIVALLGGFLQWPVEWLIGGFVAAALVPFVYSLVIYKQIEGFEE